VIRGSHGTSIQPGLLSLATGLTLWVIAYALLWYGHAMWRDELQAWMIATGSRTPIDLYWNMRNEGHPGLWHLLLWAGAQLRADPYVLRLIQAAIAGATLLLILLRSPFSKTEKLLLTASYFLIFEYGTLARSYGLGVLLLLLAVDAERRASPQTQWRAWLWLGLAANTSIFAALVSLAFAAGFITRRPRPYWEGVGSVALYLALLALAVFWMMPAPDTVFAARWHLDFDRARIVLVAGQFVSAFLPIGTSAPKFWNPVFYADVAAATGLPAPYVIALLLVALVPLSLLALGQWRTRILFVMATGLIAAFMYVKFAGAARHYGTFFIAFIGCLWLARGAQPSLLARTAVIVLLGLNAIGGLNAIYGALQRPFSDGEATADLIRTISHGNGFIAASPDAPGSAVAGYLSRPFYYPDCDCDGTFLRWNSDRSGDPISKPESPLWGRLRDRMTATGVSTGLLITNAPLDIDVVERNWPGLALTRLAAFEPAVVADESFILYQLDRAP
jgi:hypothetical protein